MLDLLGCWIPESYRCRLDPEECDLCFCAGSSGLEAWEEITSSSRVTSPCWKIFLAELDNCGGGRHNRGAYTLDNLSTCEGGVAHAPGFALEGSVASGNLIEEHHSGTMSDTLPSTPSSSQEPDLKNPDWNSFGPTIKWLSVGAGIRPELLLTYMGSVLGGLAGPFSRLTGLFGEAHRPAQSLILTSTNPGVARTLQQLAVEPVNFINDSSRRSSQVLDPTFYEEANGAVMSKVKTALKNLSSTAEGSHLDAQEAPEARQTLLNRRQDYQPSVMITSPRPETFDKLRGSVFDEHAFIFDPGATLIRNSMQTHPKSKEWRELFAKVVEGARGGIDLPVGPHRGEVLNDVLRTRTPFLQHLNQQLMGEMILHPAGSSALEVAVLLPAERVRCSHSPQHLMRAKEALRDYRGAMHGILNSRRDNSGVVLELTQPDIAFNQGVCEFEDKLDGLPSNLQRFCFGLYGLPHRLLWTALVLDDPKARSASRFVPGVLAAANWCVNRQVQLIRTALTEQERQRLLEAAAEMYTKIAERAPCKKWDVFRGYNDQRKSSHEPVLEFLCAESLVSKNGSRLELTDEKLPFWLAARCPTLN
ncbi:MAG: hypothetical protein ACI8UO_006360 [Verrucomicrobiales bacterium]